MLNTNDIQDPDITFEENCIKEGIFNRVAYGYRNFCNYKNRIILHFKLKEEKQTYLTAVSYDCKLRVF